MSKSYVNNPISVNQLVDLNVERCPEDFPDGECGGLNRYLQDLYDRVCSLENPNIDIKCFESNSFEELMQAIVDKTCCIDCLGMSSGCDESNFRNLDFCRPGGWVCHDEVCIDVVSAASTPTNEEVIQALVSRIIDLSNQVEKLCRFFDGLQTEFNEIKDVIDNQQCCD